MIINYEPSLVIIDHTFDQIIHKEGNRRIIGHKMSIILIFIRFRRINSRFKIPLLPIILKSLVKVRHRQPVIHDITCILHRHTKKLLKVLVIWLILQIIFLPRICTLPVPQQHIEVTIQQQYHIFFQLADIQLNRNGSGVVSHVFYESWLDHYHAIGNRFSH